MRKIVLVALAGLLVASAFAVAAKPPLPENAAAHANPRAQEAAPPERPERAADATMDEDVDEAANEVEDADLAGNETAPEPRGPSAQRGQGLAVALEHAPARVQAHLQSIWDAFASGLKGIGDALTKPA